MKKNKIGDTGVWRKLLAAVFVCAVITMAAILAACNKPAPPQLMLTIQNSQQGITLTWNGEKNSSAHRYEIRRAGSRLGQYTLIETLKANADTYTFTDPNPNANQYENYYKVSAVTRSGEVLVESVQSLEMQLFGENVYIYDAKYDAMQDIKDCVSRISNKMHADEMGPGRYTQFFKAGEYNNFDEFEVGFYTHFAGLGKLPSDTKFYGSIRTRPHIGNSGGFENNATCTFWRSIENIEVNRASTAHATQFQWAVSQAAPARRLNINVPSQYHRDGWASGGYIADSRFAERMEFGGQQQFYTRNNHLAAMDGVSWNRFTQGATGASHVNNFNQARTWIANTPLIREKPFIYTDGGGYKVFVPAWRENAVGVSWSEADNHMGEGISLDLVNDFYIAKPGVTAAQLNAQLQDGKHVFFTPGWYFLEEPIVVTKADTVLLGTGYATLVPDKQNSSGAMLIEDVSGVILAGVMFDAHYSSTYLLRVGRTGANNNHSENPSILSDVFLRVGGVLETPVHAEVSVQINSNNVVGDHLWVWRADHGRQNEMGGNGSAGIGWNLNTAPWGLIVSGDDVTMYGLFVEHYQKYQTLWLGENGRTYFYQNESPYDPTNQEVYTSRAGTDHAANGYAAYKVANHVQNHYAIGLGLYGVFNRTGPSRGQTESVFIDNAVEVPHAPGVQIWHALIIELAPAPNNTRATVGTHSVVNGTGAPVSNASPPSPSRITSFINGTATGTFQGSRDGVQPADEIFNIPQ
ncbi:MAG: fibronectin type III domain-containing protein [Firmicutes bacterium]|nr:fibronectin type III domain-containing protein [Bacillota bacterium]